MANVLMCDFCGDGGEGRNDAAFGELKHCVCTLSKRSTGLWGAMRVSCSTEDELYEWLQQFQISSAMTFRVGRTRPTAGRRVLFSCEYRCMHNTKPRSSTADSKLSSKNTSCGATLTLHVQKSQFLHKGSQKSSTYKRASQSKDRHMPRFPMAVHFDFCHNHPILAGDVLRHRDVGREARDRVKQLLQDNHSPQSALEVLKYDLQAEHPEDYVRLCADRYHCPDLKWCYRLYYSIFAKAYGPASGAVHIDTLTQRVEQFNKQCSNGTSERFALLCITDGGAVITAICTPLMKRVHRLLKTSSEMVFVDSSGSMDRQNYRLFLLLTHSVAGGLPLGVLITPSEDTATLTTALHLLNALLDPSCFYGRGTSGPAVFMTDDAAAERQALSAVYPEAKCLLCLFHILQAHWRYLWSAENGVPKHSRQHLFHVLKDMVYADTAATLEDRYSVAMNAEVVGSNEKVSRRLQSLYERRVEWALCLRQGLPVRDNNTNNYCESAMRVLKDNVLRRTKAFNLPQLMDFIVTRFDQHYQRRLLDVANNRLDFVRTSRFVPSTVSIPADVIHQKSDNVFEVPSQSDATVVYTVNMFLGHCTCYQGNTGGPCKHQTAVMMAFKLPSCNVLPVYDPAGRRLLHRVAVGDSATPSDDWFRSLRPSADVSSVPDSAPATAPADDLPVTQPADDDESTDADLPDADADDPLLHRLQAAVGKITEHYQRYPLSFTPALESFCNQMETLSTPAALQSALHCFGKPTQGLRRMAGLKTIGVQPTAIARRKAALGGRRRLHVGRPPRSSFAPEHGYANKIGSRHCMPHRKAVHSLATAVMRDEPLGRTHAAK